MEVPAEFTDTVYPGTRVLRNLLGIRDRQVLRQLEFEVGTARQFGIETGLVAVPATFDGAHLVAIHRALFGALYPWAGVHRGYDMGLRDQTFGAALIERYLADATVILQLPTRRSPPSPPRVSATGAPTRTGPPPPTPISIARTRSGTATGARRRHSCS